MTTQPPSERRPRGQIPVGGATMGAGVLLLTNAVLMLLEGVSAVFNDELLVAGVSGYVYQLNATTWGWIHIAVGILMGVAAIGLFRGLRWARVAVLVLAPLSIIVMFLAIPYYWVWAGVVISLDVIVIWAMAKTWSTGHPDSAA